ncbi:hypothetical protein BpHYR1_053115 [Brachionus plicatilis]|uniref:Transmembrane protein n=1 Tax=Brachionus plicatilis TaxID=10195 RepID=A0A3M7RCE5_BRAPC|nr:hypothetical protein BpHYR1_053115 [Brachionus plicatilis]
MSANYFYIVLSFGFSFFLFMCCIVLKKIDMQNNRRIETSQNLDSRFQPYNNQMISNNQDVQIPHIYTIPRRDIQIETKQSNSELPPSYQSLFVEKSNEYKNQDSIETNKKFNKND